MKYCRYSACHENRITYFMRKNIIYGAQREQHFIFVGANVHTIANRNNNYNKVIISKTKTKKQKTKNQRTHALKSESGILFTIVLFSRLAVTLFLSSHFHSISLAFARYSDISVMNICICLFVLGKCNTLWAPASTCLNQHPIDTNRHKEQSLCAPNHVLFQGLISV